MKKAIRILLVLFGIAIIVGAILLIAKVPMVLLAINIYVALTFCLPITAMLLKTIKNKSKNTDNAAYIIKMTIVLMLYAMIIFMFLSTMNLINAI